MREGGRRIGTAREGYIVPDQVEPRQKMIQNVFLSAAPAGFGLAVAAGVGELLSGLGSRWGWWPFPFGFQVLEWTAIAGLVAALLCVVGILLALHRSSRRALLSAVLGLIIGVVTAGIPAYWFAAASRAPMIHDITTDT